MEHEEGLTISHITVGKTGRAVLTVRLNGQVLKADTVNVLKESDRKAFGRAIQEAAPALGEADLAAQLEKVLLGIAEGVARQLAEVRGADREDAGGDTIADPQELLKAMPEDVRREGEALLADPDLLRHVVEDIAALGVAGECELAATVYLVGTSRLLDHPLAAIVQGPSSSGKSHVSRKTAELFPPEAVMYATKLTPQALSHMPPGSLVHRFVVAGERSRVVNDEAAEASRALREILSEGRLDKWMPVKTDGHIVTEHIEQEGPIAYVESTTLIRIDDEDLNRCILLSTDERPDQTQRILKRLAAERIPGGWTVDTVRITLRHHAAQRMLLPLPVSIPYAGRLADRFPSKRVEARRMFGHLLHMVEAVTLLHQRQRTRDADGRLLATPDDYRVASRLLSGPIARQLGGRVSDAARRFYDRMVSRNLPSGFTAQDLARAEDLTDRCVRGYFGELSTAGYIKLIEAGRGPVPHKWQLAPVPPDSSAWAGLPSAEEITSDTDFRLSGKAQVVVPAAVASEEAEFPGNSG